MQFSNNPIFNGPLQPVETQIGMLLQEQSDQSFHCNSVLLNNIVHMSLVVRKPVFGVSDLVRHKPGCAITEYG